MVNPRKMFKHKTTNIEGGKSVKKKVLIVGVVLLVICLVATILFIQLRKEARARVILHNVTYGFHSVPGDNVSLLEHGFLIWLKNPTDRDLKGQLWVIQNGTESVQNITIEAHAEPWTTTFSFPDPVYAPRYDPTQKIHIIFKNEELGETYLDEWVEIE